MLTKEFWSLSFATLLLVLLSACSGITIKDQSVCTVAGVMAAGMNCAHTLEGEPYELDLQQTIKFLEPDETTQRAGAMCMSAEDFNSMKTVIDIACEKMGAACTLELKQKLQSASHRFDDLQTKSKREGANEMRHVNQIPQPGDRGPNVVVLQAALNEKVANSKLAEDGVFGPKTRAATGAFQKSIGLEGTGIPGPKTMAALGIEIVKITSDKTVSSGLDPDEGTEPWYRRMFALCEVDPGKESMVVSTVKRLQAGRDRYRGVEKATGVPAMVIACIHWKEASCSFKKCLHNGDEIIGNGKKTWNVPAGRGPFDTWEEAAIDAIVMNGSRWKRLREGSRDIGTILYACERFNGTGYISGAGRAETSPYLWACSNVNDGKGKYVSDGKFDPDQTTQKTVGIALLLKELWKLGEIDLTGVDRSSNVA